ncbi:bifunctional WD40-YVTN repeat-like-containing domain superfamily/WD40-repeat-containing domain superfamily/WD40 repeat [Babesia duncani]|uniref:Bifunctional WD40-YVTN repeat-like-containing domain superfamily/WD40-repeat-containing domain superfamily/WD40 repeat n=1 Tax=Babesia duncani TaxID=323732 RepID=A0AAD9PK28_9APIC|nr:bifunctional WD40-YVTN repeat-like-containing domain superfamily/WD40-repeat-containing domain superfamily/WD40 repeat [Babesia duncani]
MESLILSGPEGCRIRRKSGVIPAGESCATACVDAAPQVDTTDQEIEPFYCWKRNAPFLYDSVLIQSLDWPSLSVDFCEGVNFRPHLRSITSKMLLGTHTGGAETDYAIVAELKLGIVTLSEDLSACENFVGFTTKGRVDNSHTSSLCFDTKAKLVHPGEVNRIMHVPGHPFVFCTRTAYGEVLVFDYAKHPCTPRDTTVSIPELVLSGGHSEGGYGLCWTDSSRLSSCAEDGTVCFWDIKSNSQGRTVGLHNIADGTPQASPLLKAQIAYCQLNDMASLGIDVDGNGQSGQVIVAAEDGSCKALDSRTECNSPCLELYSDAYSSAVNALDVNRHCNWIVCSGNINGQVLIWDIRNPSEPQLVLNDHKEAISSLKFCSISAGMIVSGSDDSRVIIWDLGTDAEDKRKFVHAGHTSLISDVAVLPSYWHLTGPVIASTSADNSVHVFSPAIYS